MSNQDFFPFRPTDKVTWKKQVEKDLKGKDFEKTLVSTVWDSIRQEPYYDESDTDDNVTALSFHPNPEIPALGARQWANAVEIFSSDPSSMNKQILHDLQLGADALVIYAEEEMNWEVILKQVHLEYITIYIKPIPSNLSSVFDFFEFLENSGFAKEKLKGAILWSPADSLFETNSDWNENLELAKKLIIKSSEYLHFHGLTANFTRYSDAGANGLSESVFGISELIELADGLEKTGVSTNDCFNSLSFFIGVGKNHFPEIAKLKALRILISDLANKFGVDLNAFQIEFITTSSLWTKSLIDQNNNYIRQSYEAISAILGGGNTLLVRTVERAKASELSRRVARNISSILKEESYLDKVMDPAAGSYYLESLIQNLLDTVTLEIEKLEAEGGWLKAFLDRSIHQKVRQERHDNQQAILENQVSKVGVNRYQASGNLINNLPLKSEVEKDYQLLPSRESYLVEQETLQA
ncbi:MAG: hypothetical protein HWE15_06480 [Algoriphagus sp.]|uniref:methylmalonyl-CoA mutase family protein n=1 Tax=Algoriphagus sp. TaxID=1872435 RepID=UPI0017E643CD|nr:methylmalonyl-CoA mutase family protein [Algoriphagus sp.]NVJ85932.1 hypothetical protein [Algoriphagus sp.]